MIPILEMWELRLRKISGRNGPGHWCFLDTTSILQRRKLRLRENQSHRQSHRARPLEWRSSLREGEHCIRKAKATNYEVLMDLRLGPRETRDSER